MLVPYRKTSRSIDALHKMSLRAGILGNILMGDYPPNRRAERPLHKLIQQCQRYKRGEYHNNVHAKVR